MDADNEDNFLFFKSHEICMEVLNDHCLNILSS